MADENKDRDEKLTDAKTGDEIKPTQEYTKGEAERLPEPETGLEEAVVEGVEKSEELEDSPVVEAFDEALTSVQAAAEELEPERDPEVITDFRRPMMEAAAADAVHAVPHDEHAALLSDTTNVFGNVVTVPGGIYTVVFGFLAVATVVEVLIGSLPRGAILIPVLLAIAVIKAALVVMYYMHLKTDSRLFTYIILGPTIMAVIAMLFLMSVPSPV